MYVSNLNFHTTDDGLKDLFAPFGAVSSAKIISDRTTGQSRGFGFVEMDSETEGNEAMNSLNNKDIEGRVLSVSLAKEKAPRSNNSRW